MTKEHHEDVERIEPKHAQQPAMEMGMGMMSGGRRRVSRRYLKLFMMFLVLPSFLVQILMHPCKDFAIGSQAGKTIVVTGANSGLGYYTSLFLAKSGAKVIMGCRSKVKCEEAKASILKAHPAAVPPDTLTLDLSSQASVKAFASSLLSKHRSINALVNNAGIGNVKSRAETVEGIELTFGTNHIGHFLLTQLLFKSIKEGGVIVNHSSAMHMLVSSGVFLGDYESKNSYNAFFAYAISKAANLLFTYELNDRLQASGNTRKITAVAVHPGFTQTAMSAQTAGDIIVKLIGMDVSCGAQAQILAAVGSAAASNGTFFGPKHLGVFGPPAVAGTGKNDKKAMAELWAVSERLTKTAFRI